MGYREQSSIMETILQNSKCYYTTTFDKKMAHDFIKQTYPGINDSDCHAAAEIAGYIPGCMSTNFESVNDLQERVYIQISREWETIFPFVKSSLRVKQHVKLFIGILHNLPISAIGLSEGEAKLLIPLRCFLMYLNEEKIPTFHVNLPSEVVHNMIESIQNVITQRVKSDEPAVLGYCFEGAVSHVFRNITLQLKMAFKSSQGSPSLPSDINDFQVEHTISPIRYNGTQVPLNYLYHTPQRTPSINYFSLLGKCLILVQTSVQNSQHKQKIETFVQIEECYLNLTNDGNQLNTIIYLYLNPNYEEDVSEGTNF